MGQTIQSLLPAAIKLIAEQNKLKDAQPSGWVADRVPSMGTVIYQVYAFEKDQPNGPSFSVVIDDEGKQVDLKALSKKEKVDFFPPFPRSEAAAGTAGPGMTPDKSASAATPDPNPKVESIAFAGAVAAAVAVTISPSVNDLHLEP